MMLGIVKKGNNRTKLMIVLSLICSIFSAGAIAQSKPMEANQLAALITEFKEVVSKNVSSEKDVQSIGEKWDARKDLAGKTKSQVIGLLYDDFKSVITDSGIRYQIYSIFSFYKTIPDESASTPENADPVKKVRLKNPATAKGEIGGESHDSYVIRVRKNQTLKVQIAWKEKGDYTADFVVSRSADFFAGDVIRGVSTYNGKNWHSKIGKTGDYYIYVTGHPVVNYTLRVTVR